MTPMIEVQNLTRIFRTYKKLPGFWGGVKGLFSPQTPDGAHQLVFKLGEDTSPESPLTDRAALEAGYISHTVLDFSKLGSI